MKRHCLSITILVVATVWRRAHPASAEVSIYPFFLRTYQLWQVDFNDITRAMFFRAVFWLHITTASASKVSLIATTKNMLCILLQIAACRKATLSHQKTYYTAFTASE